MLNEGAIVFWSLIQADNKNLKVKKGADETNTE